MGRRPRFTREEVEEAALAVLDEKGVTGLTVRAVAGRLGTGAMTLYNYMDSHSDLFAMAVDAAIRDISLPDQPHPDWRDDARAICHAVWRAVRPHPNAIPLILARRSRSSRYLDIAEALLRALARSGRSDHELLIAFRAASTLATAFPQTEVGSGLSTGEGTPADVIDRFAQLDAGAYPKLREIADAARTSDPETEFLQSIDALLEGLASEHKTPAASRQAPTRRGAS